MFREGWRGAAAVFGVYQLIAVAMTWPLARGLAGDVPGDLGDALLNLWILGWGAELVPRLATGQAALADYWNANIFHPEPLALSFSEHLFGQVLQTLPVYHLTGNLILAYNLLFLSSFALSGLGMYLLVRDLTGDARAAFVAGLVYAFLPFRVAQAAHLQSLSSQWMPLALVGFRRFVTGGRVRPLAGGAAALLMQHWSCGYYMVFFAPIVPLFVLHQLWAHGRFPDVRRWIGLAVAAGAVAAGTWPFLALYLEARAVHGFSRPLSEVVLFSADVYSYLSAPGALALWGTVMQAYPKAEGELFFGALPLMLAAIGVLTLAAPGREAARTASTPDAADRLRRIGTRLLAAIIAVQAAVLLIVLVSGGFATRVAGVSIRATNGTRAAINLLIAAALLLAVSSRARRIAITLLRSPVALSAILLVLSMWLSLGPVPHSAGEPVLLPPLYALFYAHVPGFDGLRVPARYAMIAGLFLAVLAGFGAAWGLKRAARAGVAAAALSAALLVDLWFAPLAVNQTWSGGGVMPPARIEPAAEAPAVYHQLATMPDDTVVAEFPFGDPAWELRYVYYSTVHWRRLVNGYSGTFPPSYATRVALLQRLDEHPDAAWRALRDAGTTHVVVHRAALAPAEAARVVAWLDDHFAVEIARFGDDLLYDVSGQWPPRIARQSLQ